MYRTSFFTSELHPNPRTPAIPHQIILTPLPLNAMNYRHMYLLPCFNQGCALFECHTRIPPHVPAGQDAWKRSQLHLAFLWIWVLSQEQGALDTETAVPWHSCGYGACIKNRAHWTQDRTGRTGQPLGTGFICSLTDGHVQVQRALPCARLREGQGLLSYLGFQQRTDGYTLPCFFLTFSIHFQNTCFIGCPYRQVRRTCKTTRGQCVSPVSQPSLVNRNERKHVLHLQAMPYYTL
jgi:hypothetical protein